MNSPVSSISKAIADFKKWATAAPSYIDQEEPVPPGGLPKPGKLEVHLPDNHLQYAITWFGLALALVVQRGGHVGAVVSKKAADRLWPVMAQFWAKRD